MFEQIIKLLEAYWPHGILLVIAIAATWLIAKQYFHWTGRVEKIEKDCSKIGSKIDGHVIPKLDALNTSIGSLVVYLKTKDKSMDAALFQSRSPLCLTAFGREFLENSGGRKFVDDNLSYLISEINKFPIKSPLDVENISSLVISNATSLDSFTPIKDYIFHKPVRTGSTGTISLDFARVSSILGIYLRDKYLQTHPDLLKGEFDYSIILTKQLSFFKIGVTA
jgi:hypothetical protein